MAPSSQHWEPPGKPGRFTPVLRADFGKHEPTWQRQCNADPFDYRLQRLDHYGFEVGGHADAKAQLRETLGSLVGDVAHRQSIGQGYLLSAGARDALDGAIAYMHPAYSLRLVSGRATELSLSTHLAGGLRLTLANQLKGWSSFADTPLVGVEWEAPLFVSWLEAYPLLRFGYQVGSSGVYDIASGAPCRADPGQCIVKQVGVALGFANVLRLQGLYEWADLSHPFSDHLIVELGLEYNFPSGPR